MTTGEAICQEFCEEVFTYTKPSCEWSYHLAQITQCEDADTELGEIEEIRCRVDVEYFTPLVERMIQGGYCCTQVQKDAAGNACTTWFEPMSPEKLV